MLYCTDRLITSCCFENEKCEKNFRVINDKVNKIRFKLLKTTVKHIFKNYGTSNKPKMANSHDLSKIS